MKIDHIVISVKDLKKSIKFYSVFLGKPKTTKWDANWDFEATKLFLTGPYKESARKFDKHNLGLNHIAFHLKNKADLNKYLDKLNSVKIKNSGVQIDEYGGKEFIWFDDLDGIRLEFYLR